MIVFQMILFSVTLLTFMGGLHGSSCDEDCADKPVFSPSSLVVQHGDGASASCAACQDACRQDQTGLDAPLGEAEKNGSVIVWQVDSVTEWDLSVTCYYTKDDGNRCCSHLPVTVYKPPSLVSMVFTRMPLDSSAYTLQCKVEDVAPIERVSLTIYSGHLPITQRQCSNTTKAPGSCVYTVNGRSGEERHGSRHWCEAKLDLGPEGPQPPLVYASKKRRDLMFPSRKELSSGSSQIQSFSLCSVLFFFSCLILSSGC